LSEEQLDKLEAALAEVQSENIDSLKAENKAPSESIDRLEAENKELNSTVATKTKEVDSLKNALSQALKDCKLESTGTAEGDAALLSAKVQEYGKLDGASLTQVVATQDVVEPSVESDENKKAEAVLNQTYKV